MASEVQAGNESATDDDTNLLEKLREMREGSVEASRMVERNVATAVSEAVFKEDHITKVTCERNAAGELLQFGQTMQSIHRNSIVLRPNRHPLLQEITRTEALNGHRIEDAVRAGVLKDHYLLVPSIVPEGVPEEDLGHNGDGYFLESLTFVLQATTEAADGTITTESGFMAGVHASADASFDERMAQRHDIKALTELYEAFGQQAPTTAAGFLERGLYIPKELMKHGVADVMRWCEMAVGKARPAGVYLGLLEESKRREASMADVRQMVTDELLERVDEFEGPMDVVGELWHLVKKYSVPESFRNKHIDPRVFGSAAAGYVEQIRTQIQNGQEVDPALVQKAQEEAVITGCGGGAGGENGGESRNSEDPDADCDYISKMCPLCGAKGVKTMDKKVSGRVRRISGTCGCSKTYTKAA